MQAGVPQTQYPTMNPSGDKITGSTQNVRIFLFQINLFKISIFFAFNTNLTTNVRPF